MPTSDNPFPHTSFMKKAIDANREISIALIDKAIANIQVKTLEPPEFILTTYAMKKQIEALITKHLGIYDKAFNAVYGVSLLTKKEEIKFSFEDLSKVVVSIDFSEADEMFIDGRHVVDHYEDSVMQNLVFVVE